MQWAEKGSYRVEHVVKFVDTVPPKRSTELLPGLRQILTLDDYSAHLDPTVKKAVYKRGYWREPIPGGITGDTQVNDTHYHHSANVNYRDEVRKILYLQLAYKLILFKIVIPFACKHLIAHLYIKYLRSQCIMESFT